MASRSFLGASLHKANSQASWNLGKIKADFVFQRKTVILKCETFKRNKKIRMKLHFLFLAEKIYSEFFCSKIFTALDYFGEICKHLTTRLIWYIIERLFGRKVEVFWYLNIKFLSKPNPKLTLPNEFLVC